MYFNEKQKTEFLEDLKEQNDNYYGIAKKLFAYTSDYEASVNRDIVNETLKIILTHLYDKGLQSSVTLTRYGYVVNTYKKWALTKNLITRATGKPIMSASAVVKNIFKTHSDINIYTSPQKLMEALDRYYPLGDSLYLIKAEIIRAYIVLLYQGFSNREIVKLLCDNVIITPGYMAVYNERKIAIIHKEFIPTIKKAYHNTQFYSDRIIPDPGSEKYLIKMGSDGEEVALKRIKDIMTNSNKESHFQKIPENDRDIFMMGRIYEYKKIKKVKERDLYNECSAYNIKPKEQGEKREAALSNKINILMQMWGD